LKDEFANNQNYKNNLHYTTNANCKRWQTVVEKEYRRERIREIIYTRQPVPTVKDSKQWWRRSMRERE